jgi:hypothetical protein
MFLVRPSHVKPEIWNLVSQPSVGPCVVIQSDGTSLVCDGWEGPYVPIPATDPEDTSGLTVIVRGKRVSIPWTRIVAVCPQREIARMPGAQSRIDNSLRPHYESIDKWIDTYLDQTRKRATPVSEFRAFDLGKAFRRSTLENAFAVEELRVERLPLSQLGLTELRDFEKMPFDAITYKNTVFVHRGRLSESLAFHEMVHVVQWDEVGPENFLIAYGIGLMAWGYVASPLEVMAYNFQAAFEGKSLPLDVEQLVRDQTRQIVAKPMEHPPSP